MLSKWLMLVAALGSAGIVSVTTGCASGGWKLTRDYARFVNRQHIIIRCILYILTSVVFVATMIIDAVIFNTMDFWQGRVSQGTFEFQQDGRRYIARHSISAETQLRQSQIEVFAGDHRLQDLTLREVSGGKIDVFVNGVHRGQVENIESLPMISFFDAEGKKTGSQAILADSLIAKASR